MQNCPMPKTTCPRKECGHTWEARTDNPVSCPKCKQYFKTVQVKHLPSDYPPSDEALMEAQAEAEAKYGEQRTQNL